jgi:hypothetical protein
MGGMKPFVSYRENATEHREEAHALLRLLSSAFQSGANAGGTHIGDCNPELVAMALEGIASLVALSEFNDRCADHRDGERRAAK